MYGTGTVAWTLYYLYDRGCGGRLTDSLSPRLTPSVVPAPEKADQESSV